MNVANQELSKKLSKLSGWNDTPYEWTNAVPNKKWYSLGRPPADSLRPEGEYHAAYDAHYLFNKLLPHVSPEFILQSDGKVLISYTDVRFKEWNFIADSPEDCLATVAIDLIERGEIEG